MKWSGRDRGRGSGDGVMMGSAEIGLYVALHMLQDKLETSIGHLTGDVQQAACNNPK